MRNLSGNSFALGKTGPTITAYFVMRASANTVSETPMDKPGLVENGHYRHAFYSEKSDTVYVWVCRSCFKRVQPLVNWSIRRSKTGPARLGSGRRESLGQ